MYKQKSNKFNQLICRQISFAFHTLKIQNINKTLNKNQHNNGVIKKYMNMRGTLFFLCYYPKKNRTKNHHANFMKLCTKI